MIAHGRTMITMYEKTIQFKTVDAVQEFNRKISHIMCDVDLISLHRRAVIDAKSIMGILSLDLTQPITLRAITNDMSQIKNINDIITEVCA